MIIIWWGMPRAGKTYSVTREALRALKKGKKKVFSNYPIYHPKYGSTYIWTPDLFLENVTDSVIIIDEAYRFFNSRNFKNFTPEEHLFFALNGQNNNDIHLIAHAPQRIDVVIREMANTFNYVRSVKIPFTERPIWFKVEGFLDELSISQRYMKPSLIYSKERFLFRKSIAKCYDTHYFRQESNTDKIYQKWVTDE